MKKHLDYFKKMADTSRIWKCNSCQHEWQGSDDPANAKCAWCGETGSVIGNAYRSAKSNVRFDVV